MFGFRDFCSTQIENKLLYFKNGQPIAEYQFVGMGQVSETIFEKKTIAEEKKERKSMNLYLHNNRHVVVERSRKGDAVTVSWVALHAVEGSGRRGRRPNYDKPVMASNLVPLSDDQVSESARTAAANILSQN
jgi:hypothetical protein